MTPKELLYAYAKKLGITLRHTRSARAIVTDPTLLKAIDASYYGNEIIKLPYSRELQLKLSWNADIWDPTDSILPDKSRMFCGVNKGKRYAIVLVDEKCDHVHDLCEKCGVTNR